MDQMTWNIESEYPSLQSSQFRNDYDFIKIQLQEVRQKVEALPLRDPIWQNPGSGLTAQGKKFVQDFQEAILHLENTSIVFANIATYLNCQISVDSLNSPAKKIRSEIEALHSQIQQMTAPITLFVTKCTSELFQQLIHHPQINAYQFQWEKWRKSADFVLNEKEEVLLKAMAVDGHNAWANLYEAITGKGKCVLRVQGNEQVIGISQALAMKSDPIEENRKAAWLGLNEFWTQHEESAAAILNALAGWRHAENEKRSQIKPRHFLDPALESNCISRQTLDAMMQACESNKNNLHQIFPLMSKKLGKTKMDPWDLYAPNPEAGTSTRSFEQSFHQVLKSFEKIDPQMGQFAKMAHANRWMDSRVLPNKAGGAYCTRFAKSKEPRVFMSYCGSVQDLITLAHELGHAFHGWVLRDLPFMHHRYPMTLAETASVFAETAVREDMINSTDNAADRSEFVWNQMESILGYLINIPARFDFEKRFYELRQKNVVSAAELSELMDQTWTKWYGENLTQNDRLFWASKLHFSMAKTSFYNFPYTFGYLFSLSIYARRNTLGKDFMSTYIAILQDTGRMSAEDLIQKHLGEDIQKPQFWQSAFDVVNQQIADFAKQ